MVVVCALAFLTVSSAHAMSHFEGVNGKSGAEISMVAHADDASDADNHPVSGADNHPVSGADTHSCCGCSPIATFAIAFMPVDLEGCALVVLEVASLEPRVPSLESPYPISSI